MVEEEEEEYGVVALEGYEQVVRENSTRKGTRMGEKEIVCTLCVYMCVCVCVCKRPGWVNACVVIEHVCVELCCGCVQHSMYLHTHTHTHTHTHIHTYIYIYI